MPGPMVRKTLNTVITVLFSRLYFRYSPFSGESFQPSLTGLGRIFHIRDITVLRFRREDIRRSSLERTVEGAAQLLSA